MSIRYVLSRAVCAAGLVFPQVLSAQVVVAQPPATSDRRLPVQKDVSRTTITTTPRSGMGSLSVMARDSADRARRDSVERRRQQGVDSTAAERMREEQRRRDATAQISRDSVRSDSVMKAAAANASAMQRADSVRHAQQMAQQLEEQRQQRGLYRFRGSGFYMGLATGAVMPTGNLRNLGYNSGLNVNVPLGWHSQSQLLGVRLDLGYAQFRGRDFSGDLPNGSTLVLNNINPKVLSATGNVTLRAPLTPSRNLNAYALSGVGIYQFRSFGSKTALGGFLGNDVLTTSPVAFQSVRNKMGAQFGAGLEVGVGAAALYIESRVVNIFAKRENDVQFDDFFGSNRGQNLRWVPIMVGINIR